MARKKLYFGHNAPSLTELLAQMTVTTNPAEAELYGRYIYSFKASPRKLTYLGFTNDKYGLHFRYKTHEVHVLKLEYDQLNKEFKS